MIANAWSRIFHHRGEILKSLTICWCKVLEEDTLGQYASLEQVQTEIRRSVTLLTAVVKRDVDVAVEYDILRASDNRLGQLWGVELSETSSTYPVYS